MPSSAHPFSSWSLTYPWPHVIPWLEGVVLSDWEGDARSSRQEPGIRFSSVGYRLIFKEESALDTFLQFSSLVKIASLIGSCFYFSYQKVYKILLNPAGI